MSNSRKSEILCDIVFKMTPLKRRMRRLFGNFYPKKLAAAPLVNTQASPS